MTDQEGFDKVWDWFVVQKKPAGKEPGTKTCHLRTENECKCALGVLIPDEEYHEAMERQAVHPDTLKEMCPSLQGYSTMLLEELRGSHDGAAILSISFTRGITERLTAVAEKLNLTTPQATA